MKKIIIIAIFAFLLFTTINNANALSTYVGVRIDNLTDDPASSCAGEPGYGSQGRIRAIAAILPTYPIYFNLSNENKDTVWDGDGTEDTDYTIGDIMYIPDSVDLTIGENYNIFFDIDALRIFLPLPSATGFTSKPDDNYYTIGDNVNTASGFSSVADSCAYSGTFGGGTASPMIYDDRTITTGRKITTTASQDFKMDNKYNGLSGPTVGNFNIAFTMS